MGTALKHSMHYGAGYIFESQTCLERSVVEDMYKAGYLSVVVVSAGFCWGMCLKSKNVIILDAMSYVKSDSASYDLIKMVSMAVCKQIREKVYCLLMCHSSKKETCSRILSEAFPVESKICLNLHDTFNALIICDMVKDIQEAVDFFTWTFF